ncbi:MAG: hypothetical protein A2Y33_06915 [Spirochaetes bacterium GWF1_51_8]|nr:MAG: hypothetical protein A2Y33_06915 [Spirochaetes bacterium GWF1_51_8]
MEDGLERIATKAYGEIEVPENSAIQFVGPILGFEEFQYYYLLEVRDLPGFYWLQSKQDANVAFIVIDPRTFMKDYELVIDKIDMDILEIGAGDEVLDYVIVNIPEDPAKMTMNILGPIVINAAKRLGIQGISNKNDYDTKRPIFHSDGEEAKAEKEAAAGQ